MKLKKTRDETLKYTTELGPTILKAKLGNRAIDYPDDYTAQIDLDSDSALAEFRTKLSFFSKLFSIKEVRVTRSLTPKHYHARVVFDVTFECEAERILVQAILGSDYRREIIALARLKAGDEHPSLLFERIILDDV